jgi:hypothetical protein
MSRVTCYGVISDPRLFTRFFSVRRSERSWLEDDDPVIIGGRYLASLDGTIQARDLKIKLLHLSYLRESFFKFFFF